MTSPNSRRAHIVGLGLIGGSLARALSATGWTVSGVDANDDVTRDAVRRGIVASTTCADPPDVAFIATPAGEVAPVARTLLDSLSDCAISDVAGIKSGIVSDVGDPRFVGGHPMAGSEAVGLDGTRSDLFERRTWILTPTSTTSPRSFCTVFTAVVDVGAHVVSLEPDVHDRLAALLSHVPHVLAGSLVSALGDEQMDVPCVGDLAAGGFRDMTRVAAGDATIWPDVLIANSAHVRAFLDDVRDRSAALLGAVDTGDRAAIVQWLTRASAVRTALPAAPRPAGRTHTVVVSGPSGGGIVAAVAIGATHMGITLGGASVTTDDLGDDEGVRVLTDADGADRLSHHLRERGFSCSVGAA